MTPAAAPAKVPVAATKAPAVAVKKGAAPTAPRVTVAPPAPAPNVPEKAPAIAAIQVAAPLEPRAEAPPPAPAVMSRKSAQPAPAAVKLPAILFEGDFPPPAPDAPTGPGQRFELGPVSPPPPTPMSARAAELPELPESYGTGRLLMTPRDPFWLYAHWDFSFEHLRRFNSRSVDGHLVLRVYQNTVSGAPVTEIHLHPESREWFVNVPMADTAYVADLGYYSAPGRWKSVVQSPVVRTPAAVMSADLTVQFASVPVEAALQQVIEAVQESAALTPAPAPLPTAPIRAAWPPALIELTPVESSAPAAPLPPAPVESARVALPPAVAELTPVGSSAPATPLPGGKGGESPSPGPAAIPTVRAVAPTAPAAASPERTDPPPSPAPASGTQTAWTPAQERAFGAIIKLVEEVRRTWGGSEELVALIRQQLGEAASHALAPTGQPGPLLPLETPSSASLAAPAPANVAPPKSGFWFNVNAELVIYGATEPDAEVTIGGRVIKLRKDGTFGYRFALPDGNFALPVVAIAEDRSDGRAADLRFSRQTEYRGDVAAHPQYPALKPPTVENVA